MRSAIFFAFVGSLAITTSCPVVVANGPSIVDKDLNISLTLPDGFERVFDIPSPPGEDFRYVFKRVNPDGRSTVCVFVERMGGVIGREPLKEEVIKKMGDVGHYREKWKSFDVDVFVVKETEGGFRFVTRNVQIPIKPYAIQLKVFGLESQDAELAELTRTLLASFDGPSNWLTDRERGERLGEGIFKMACCILVIGAFVYGLAAWRTGAFRTKAILAGIPMEVAYQKIRPSWAWYLLGAYVFFGCTCASSWIVLRSMSGAGKPGDVLGQAMGLELVGLAVSRTAWNFSHSG